MSETYLHALQIGGVTLENNVLMAPMAGISDLPFRLLCSEQGAGLVTMEMISAKAICYGNRKTAELMQSEEEERPVSMQLFGCEPEFIAKALDIISERPEVRFDLLDINMGCPVPKVVNNGEGSALMKDPALIEKIVRAASEHTDKPVTVKLRKGFDDAHINAVECALAAQEGGAKMVAVHGRTRPQMYSGTADWTIIADVKAAMNIPVIGNGDVTDGKSAKRLIDETGCDGVMIARASQGNPWIFREVKAYLEDGTILERPTNREVMQMIMRHSALMRKYKSEKIAIQEMRKHVAWYLAGFPGAARVRSKVNAAVTFAQLEDLLKKEYPYAF